MASTYDFIVVGAAIVCTFCTIPLVARVAKAAVDLFTSLEDELGRDGGFMQLSHDRVAAGALFQQGFGGNRA